MKFSCRSSLLVYNLYLLLCRKEQAAYILNEQFCFAKHNPAALQPSYRQTL